MTGTGTSAPLARSNAAGAAMWALGFVLVGWALATGAVRLWYSEVYGERMERNCSAVFSCMTPGQTATLYVMFTLPLALGGWLVASLLVLLAQLSRVMRSWRPVFLGATMAAIVLSVAGVIVLKYLVDEYQRYR